MIRVLCIENDIGAAANFGGPVETRGKTFDIYAPQLEAWLTERDKWIKRSVTAVEVIEALPPNAVTVPEIPL